MKTVSRLKIVYEIKLWYDFRFIPEFKGNVWFQLTRPYIVRLLLYLLYVFIVLMLSKLTFFQFYTFLICVQNINWKTNMHWLTNFFCFFFQLKPCQCDDTLISSLLNITSHQIKENWFRPKLWNNDSYINFIMF